MYKLTGRLTKDATVNTTPSGKTVVNFSLAENIRVGKGENAKNVTNYYDCSYWKSDKVAKILTTGKLVELQGFFKAKAYIDKEGKAVPVNGFNTLYVNVLASPKSGLVNTRSNNAAPAMEAQELADDLPF